MTRSFTFVETREQVRWIASAHRDSALDATLVAATPEAAYECQLQRLDYARLDDFTTSSNRRSEYSRAVAPFLAWQHWLDQWARDRIPDFERTAFRPAEGAAFRLQRLHGEIWATARSVGEFFDAADPLSVSIWQPTNFGVALNLEPGTNSTVTLVADAARVRGIPVVDLGRDRGSIACAPRSPLHNRSLAQWGRDFLLQGSIRSPAAALKSGGLGDACRALSPVAHDRRVLACGFGYDVQRLALQLRREGIGVTQISNRLDERRVSADITAQINSAAPDLMASQELWRPIESCGVGRTPLWADSIERWWLDLVPRLWATYLAAQYRIGKRRFDAVVLSDLGSGDFGSMVRQVAGVNGIPTYLYQHGGSADLDAASLLPWVAGPDGLLLYGTGTEADLAATAPPTTGCTAAFHPVGSATLDELDAKGRTAYHRRLRRTLQATDSRPLVLYVPTHLAPYFRAVGQLADHPVVPYFELVQRVLSIFAETDGVRLVFKDFAVANDASRVIPEFIRGAIPDAIVTTVPLRDVMWAVDAIIVDHVITAASEVLLTDVPCAFYMPSTTPQAAKARCLLRAAATVDETEQGFVDSVRRLVSTRDFRSVPNRDRSFLSAYGTGLDDGLSARRAADVIIPPVQWAAKDR